MRDDVAEATGDQATQLRAWWQRRSVGAATLATILFCLSFLNDPGGYLGTDTGGKTATLEAMVQRGDWSVDIGYWAETTDPDGSFHPLFGTARSQDGWTQVTTVPMIIAARPLYALGGYRAALLLPIAGTVASALAAAALATRLAGAGAGTRAFWMVGLASPLVVYALDLWEHSLGVAFVAWACVMLLDTVRRRAWPASRAFAAGALLAAAGTMRTETLVYSLVLVGGTCVWTMVRVRAARAAATGAATVLGFAPVWLLNGVLEGAVGAESRTDRATGAASAGGADLGIRLEEGLRTTFATGAGSSWTPVFIGALLVGAVLASITAGHRLPEGHHTRVVAGLASITLLTVLPGLGFVPGLFAAFPLAAAGLAWSRMSEAGRVLSGCALAALPVVWTFQFVGGAGPQWGGRYVLVSAVLLGTTGAVVLGSGAVPRAVVSTVVAMSVVVTAFGVAWLRERSNDVVHLFKHVTEVQEEALIARNPFLLREAGPVALRQRWLSAADPSDLAAPARVLREEKINEFSVLQVEGQPMPDVAGAHVLAVDRIPALGVTFEVVHLRFA